jgi:geranylgeranyl pyrophosphate synthase
VSVTLQEKYFQEMRLVSSKTDAEMQLIADLLSRESAIRNISQAAIELITKRVQSGRPKLRPFLFVVASETRLPEIPQYIIRLAAIAELINIATYLLNLSVDRKGGQNGSDRSHQWLSGIVLESFCLKLIENISDIPPDTKLAVSIAFSNGFQRVMEGLAFDIGEMSDVDHCLSCDLEQFLKQYVKRCQLLGGASLHAICLAAASVSGCGEQQRNALVRYGLMHGVALQVINDIADFVPVTRSGKSVGKSTEDQFADLRNHRVTLPVFQFCKQTSPEERNHLFGQGLIPRTEASREMLQMLKKVDAFSDPMQLATAADAMALEALFPLNDEFGDLLRLSLQVSQSNRFFKYLHQRGVLNGVADNQRNEIIRKTLETCLTT